MKILWRSALLLISSSQNAAVVEAFQTPTRPFLAQKNINQKPSSPSSLSLPSFSVPSSYYIRFERHSDRHHLPRLLSMRMSMSSISMSQANLAVAIDQPLLPAIPRSLFVNSVVKVVVSDIFKSAVVAFLLAFSLSLFARHPSIQWQATKFCNIVKGQASRLWEKLRPAHEGVPMTFDPNDNDGWGVCTLRGKKKLGKTSFVQYDFDLPKSDYVLPLKLGQQVSLCCLDETGNVAKGNFYSYSSGAGNQKFGCFSILAPEKTPEDTQFSIGPDSAHFIRVLRDEMKVGDEVALRPGTQQLEYRGNYFPVTDMVYIAYGVGIVPILDQIRAVLPSGSSSVKMVTVVWINEQTTDFDQSQEQLEREYFKYITKLAVSCLVDNLKTNTLADNKDAVRAIPNFSAGTMAVLSGPKEVCRKAVSYLIKRGYPEDCICVL